MLEARIKSLKVEISDTNKKIFSTCKHNWVRDWDAHHLIADAKDL